ncbi:MAG: hypothetical protein WC072_00530 [Methanoregulaceae archaeon]|nr:HAMP domain-containing protein [Methanoregulaceae archaeon]HRX33490.1 HAMP domain-containing protein [Methanoregulaceae archaeon]
MNQKLGIATKITVIYLILILLTAGVATIAVNNAAKDIFREGIRDNLKNSAGIMGTQVNATEILLLQPGDEGTPEYMALAGQLDDMRSSNDYIVNAYIMRVDADGKIEFIVDDFWLEDPMQSAMIGEIYETPDRDEIFMALSVPTASRDMYTDRWGTYVSGYAPIRDENGNTVAVLGVDIMATRMSESMARFDGLLAAAFLAVLLIGTGAVFLLTRSVARDLTELSDAVESISAGERMVGIDTSRTDEIGDLSNAIAGLEEKMK